MSETPDLNAAVCRVMLAVRYIEKTGWNAFHKYKYASHEDITSALQSAMATEGLSLVPCEVDSTVERHADRRNGGAQFRTDVTVRYMLCHTSGQSRVVMSAGCGIDGEDKGVYKAMTGAHKYALTELFLIPSGDDAERAAEPKPATSKPEAAALRKAFFGKWNKSFPPADAAAFPADVCAQADMANDENRKRVTQAWFKTDSLTTDALTALDRAVVLTSTERLRKMSKSDFGEACDKVLGASK